MPNLVMRFDLRSPEIGAPREELYRACLEMAAWADTHGFDTLQVAEHHGADDGYCPSPHVLAAAIAARTRSARLRIAALLLTLRDPIQAAEDLAVLDLVSGGRVDVLLGAGYRPTEFEMFGVDPARRGDLMEAGVATLRAAWTGEPFEVGGRIVRVTPRPLQRPHPPLQLGGSSRAAARRAARLGLAFVPTDPALIDAYEDECRRLGTAPLAPPYRGPLRYVYVADDPDAAWRTLAPHAMHEANSYAEWLVEGNASAAFTRVDDADGLRTGGPYAVVTPEECVQLAEDVGTDGSLVFHPLVGGLPPEAAWMGLELFASDVLPRIR